MVKFRNPWPQNEYVKNIVADVGAVVADECANHLCICFCALYPGPQYYIYKILPPIKGGRVQAYSREHQRLGAGMGWFQ